MNLCFKTNDYQEFLSSLSSFTNIDSRILDNLIKLKLIDNIFNISNLISISDNFYSHHYNLSLKKNYENIPEYIFASYPLHNKDFNVLPFDENNHIYKYQLINYNAEQPIILYFNKNSISAYIDIYFSINLQLFTDLNIQLLSSQEFLDFQNYIIWELRVNGLNYSINSVYLKSKKYFFLNIMCIELESSNLKEFDLYIKESKVRYQDLILSIKNSKKDEIDKFFEPALLRQELNDF